MNPDDSHPDSPDDSSAKDDSQNELRDEQAPTDETQAAEEQTTQSQGTPLVDSEGRPVVVEEIDPEVAKQRQVRAAYQTHFLLLGISAVVVLMSVVMRVPGEERVFLPLMDQPIPGMCVSRQIMGFECPGCGLTRSFICLGHGRIVRAWHFNPAGLPLYLFVVAQIPWRVFQIVRLRMGLAEKWTGRFDWALFALAGLLLLQWIIRRFE